MTPLERDHHAVGWNDTEHGINHWTDSDTWKNPLEWALYCKQIAKEMMPKAKGAHNRAYYQGVIDCVNQYQNTGKVDEKERVSFEELNL